MAAHGLFLDALSAQTVALDIVPYIAVDSFGWKMSQAASIQCTM